MRSKLEKFVFVDFWIAKHSVRLVLLNIH